MADEHEIVASLTRVRDLLAEMSPGDDPGTLAFLERARKRSGVLSVLVEAADLDIVDHATVEAVVAQVTAAVTELDAVAGDPEVDKDHIDDAGIYLGRGLTAAAPLLLAAPIVAPDQQREAAQSFRRSAGQLIHSLVEDGEGVSAKLAEVRAEAEAISQSQAQRETEATEALAQLQREILDQEARTTALLAQLQAQFLEAENTRQDAATAAVAAVKTTAEANAQSVAATAQGLIEQLEKHRDDAAALVNAVGDNAFAGGHGVYANEERGRADFWRWVTVIALIVVAGLGGWYLLTVGTTEFSVQGFWIRAVLILPFAVLAAYAARQSGRHRNNEVGARNRALELLALDPYLALLPEEIRQEVKVKMADRFFQGTASLDVTDDASIVRELAEFLRSRPEG